MAKVSVIEGASSVFDTLSDQGESGLQLYKIGQVIPRCHLSLDGVDYGLLPPSLPSPCRVVELHYCTVLGNKF